MPPEPLTLDAVNHLDRSTFVALFGGVFEHSPWVADQAWARRPFGSLDEMHRAMVDAVEASGPERQLELIMAHTDLADRSRRARELTGFSEAEQAAAGLNDLSGAEGDRQAALNRAYRERFGFPFIMAVKHSTKDQILAAMEQRMRNDAAAEFRRALDEIARIGRFRLEDLVRDGA